MPLATNSQNLLAWTDELERAFFLHALLIFFKVLVCFASLAWRSCLCLGIVIYRWCTIVSCFINVTNVILITEWISGRNRWQGGVIGMVLTFIVAACHAQSSSAVHLFFILFASLICQGLPTDCSIDLMIWLAQEYIGSMDLIKGTSLLWPLIRSLGSQ